MEKGGEEEGGEGERDDTAGENGTARAAVVNGRARSLARSLATMREEKYLSRFGRERRKSARALMIEPRDRVNAPRSFAFSCHSRSYSDSGDRVRLDTHSTTMTTKRIGRNAHSRLCHRDGGEHCCRTIRKEEREKGTKKMRQTERERNDVTLKRDIDLATRLTRRPYGEPSPSTLTASYAVNRAGLSRRTALGSSRPYSARSVIWRERASTPRAAP